MAGFEDQARAALAAKGTAEQELARLALCPPWRHAAFAGVVATLVVAPAVSLPLRFGVLAAVFASIFLIVRSDRRRLGVFINGYRRGRTRLVTFPMLGIILGLYIGSLYCSEELGRPKLSIIFSVAAFAIGYLGSALWQKVFVRELGA